MPPSQAPHYILSYLERHTSAKPLQLFACRVPAPAPPPPGNTQPGSSNQDLVWDLSGEPSVTGDRLVEDASDVHRGAGESGHEPGDAPASAVASADPATAATRAAMDACEGTPS